MTENATMIFRALIRRYGAVTVRAALKEARRAASDGGSESNSLEFEGFKTKHYLRDKSGFKATRSQR